MDEAKVVVPRINNGSEKINRPEDVLDLKERLALSANGDAKRLFLPANLQKFLSTASLSGYYEQTSMVEKMKRVTIFALGLISGLAIFVASRHIWDLQKLTKVHMLKQPLIVSSNTAGRVLHLLPAGATLYFDKSFPEGFTRYKIYVNIDRMPLALRELADPSEIDPLAARVFDKPALAQALRDYQLTRAELAANRLS